MIAIKQTKGDKTRALILQTAIDLFKEKGYEETTMRTIAERANVALGNAYYYFRSKEHLVQAFYERVQTEQLGAWSEVLANETTLKGRLLGILLTELRVIEPYHHLSIQLFKSAADPESPLSPFSKESSTLRQRCINLYEDLVKGAKETIPEDMKADLPYLLWLYQMGIILFWIHDRSTGRIRTHFLVINSVEIITSLISIMSMPIAIPIRKKLLKLVATMLRDLPQDTAVSEPAGEDAQ